MSAHSRLVLASVFFAVAWTLGMVWWNSPLDRVGILIWVVVGLLAGGLWYWAMRWWMKRSGQLPG